MTRALVIGAGGLGCPALLAMADAGVAEIGILEPDRVELHNLHRQILYREEDVGSPKAQAALQALGRRFPRLRVEARNESFDPHVHDWLSGFDVVLDGTDRFETKLAIADVCLDRGVPFVFGAAVGHEGQVLAVLPGTSACPRCLFDDGPPPGAAPSCDEIGILGPVGGITGAEQAARALALLGGKHEVLDRLWTYDGKRDRVREIELRRAPDCLGCGSRRAERAQAAASSTRSKPGSRTAAEDVVLDLSGAACPSTFIETRKALERLPPGGRLWVHLTSDESARNVPASAIAAGHRLVARFFDGSVHRLLLEKAV
jgi:adenylyltransferase/sulfurtransferase